jgi:hypothetical protein
LAHSSNAVLDEIRVFHGRAARSRRQALDQSCAVAGLPILCRAYTLKNVTAL